ncbi:MULTISPECIES: DUF4381 domain-containing protein [unclassified Cupriavidus]|uniref:DUF4381 domain-containing protein n=2 Tax=Cupriavidus TaxID=106589 RepID=UPI000400C3DF|nr:MULTISPECIES: DUF4381 domain-containing protein [unclassified Cupriavidus]MBP0637825.1 DUF4381 domain-containing protein [Cupriavidus sp. AcVe19-6a]
MSDLTHSTAAPDSATIAGDLQQMAEVVVPPPPSWRPQTIGWPVAGAIVLALLAFATWRWWRRYRANRYRREALAELARLRASMSASPQARARALVAMAELLKRTALAAWPRTEVASMAGAEWAQFLRTHAGKAGAAAPVLATLVSDAQYRDAAALAQWPDSRVTATAAACQQWIAGHHVPV